MLLSPNHPKTKREPVGLSKQVLQKTELISNVFEERFNCQRINSSYRLFNLRVQSPIRCNFPFSPSDCFSLPYREPYCETSTIHNPAYGWGGKKKQNLRQTKNRFIPGNTLFAPYFKIATNKDPFCSRKYFICSIFSSIQSPESQGTSGNLRENENEPNYQQKHVFGRICVKSITKGYEGNTIFVTNYYQYQ